MKPSAPLRLWIVLLFLTGLPAQAQPAQTQVDPGDNAWVLVCSALVLVMTGPGLTLFYGGLVRKKNLLGTMIQSFMMIAVITILWGVVGYSLAFAPGNSFIGGLDYLLLNGVGTEPSGSISHLTFMVFQVMFAIITPPLIGDTFAERMKFTAMLVFMILWAFVVYFPMAHMVWGPGGLLNAFHGDAIGCLDFAGGTMVHVSSGISALVCTLVIGKRRGYAHDMMRPNNLPLSFIGAFLLWVGWFGFNAGSALEADGITASAFAATHFAAAAGLIGRLVAEWIRDGKPSMLGGITGRSPGWSVLRLEPASSLRWPL